MSLRLGLVFLLACSSSTLVDGDAGAASDSAAPDGAADVAVLDAEGDAASPDAGNDVGNDSGPTRTPELARSLMCETNPDEALEMITRYVACSWSEYYLPVSTIYLWWESGLLGARNAQTLRELPYSCDDWRCIQQATTCAEVYECQAPGDECVDGQRRCVGDEAQQCTRGRYSTVTDCAALGDGFSCESEDVRAWCQSGECRVGIGWDLAVRCEDDALVVCEGADALRVPCDEVRPGSGCAVVAPEGEIPVDYCGLPGASGVVYGNEPVRCEEGVAIFESFYSGELRVDCAAAGYSRCMPEFGCIF